MLEPICRFRFCATRNVDSFIILIFNIEISKTIKKKQLFSWLKNIFIKKKENQRNLEKNTKISQGFTPLSIHATFMYVANASGDFIGVIARNACGSPQCTVYDYVENRSHGTPCSVIKIAKLQKAYQLEFTITFRSYQYSIIQSMRSELTYLICKVWRKQIT
ncbi:hypothetical protein PUN28_017701 [Cardiocondyla obscurior]|uniref:Uncharacterized protein n=1 Tax=Cardiocondyla obscurior TaxID=286306 RepID=A0AAW2EP23_9HYME